MQANLVLVPTVANLRERAPRSIPAIYRESYRVIFFLSVPAFAFLTAVSPIISRIWIGRYEPAFVIFVALLAAGWLVNILSNPAYVVDLGTGALKWVTIGCGATCVLNSILGYTLGRRLGGIAVVACSVAALALGYMIILIAYHILNRVAFSELMPDHSAGIALASLFGLAICMPIFIRDATTTPAPRLVTYAVAAAAALVLAIPIWVHPLRRRLVTWVFSGVATSES